MLLRMYLRWAERRGFDVELDEVSRRATRPASRRPRSSSRAATPTAGCGPSTACTAWCACRPFNAQGKRQTAFAALTVVPFLEEVDADIEIDEQGPAHRHLPVVGRRRPARQRDRLGGAPHPPADRHRRVVPERAQPAPEQGPGHADPQGQAGRARAPGARGRAGRHPGRAAARWASAARSAPTCCSRTRWSRTCATSYETGNVDGVLDGDLDAVHGGLPALAAGRRADDG